MQKKVIAFENESPLRRDNSHFFRIYFLSLINTLSWANYVSAMS